MRSGIAIQDYHEGGLQRLLLFAAKLLIQWSALAPPQPQLEFARIVAEFSRADQNMGERDGDRAANKFCCLDYDRLCDREGGAVSGIRELGE